jgi:hypothetical protein
MKIIVICMGANLEVKMLIQVEISSKFTYFCILHCYIELGEI